MDQGFYSAAAGLFVQQKSIDVLANNMANVNTAGYKTQTTVESSFAEYVLARVNTDPNVNDWDIGTANYITVVDEDYTDFSEGNLRATERNVDMAIQGSGFFVINTAANGQVLTRNGQFEVDDQGNLVLPGAGEVLGTDGQPINIGTSDFTVDGAGNMRVDGELRGTLWIVNVDNQEDLTQVGEGFFQAANGFAQEDVENFNILQKYLEVSNTDLTKEMSSLIARQNLYNSCSQLIKIFDRIHEISANQVGKTS
ncbi:flagellar hook-basal body protein [Eubacteriaceae bacterium ES3]|nr:flagellar hook-basal body protein [Eubacteriaceae bacterium ES3]